jgi:hypothetical protein
MGVARIDTKTFRKRVDHFVKDDMEKRSFYVLLEALEKNQKANRELLKLFKEINNYMVTQGFSNKEFQKKIKAIKTSLE